MGIGSLAELVRPLRGLPRAVRVLGAPDADALVSAFAAGASDWIVLPEPPAEHVIAWCTEVVYRRPLAAACAFDPSSGRLEVLLQGTWVHAVLETSAPQDDLALLAVRPLWLSAWARMLTVLEGSGELDGIPARDHILAFLIHPAPMPLHEALGVSREYLKLLGRRLAEAGFMNPRRVAVTARVLLAWEELRVGGETLDDVAESLGYSGVPALDRALRRVAGVAARKLSTLTDIELAPRLVAAIRRAADPKKVK